MVGVFVFGFFSLLSGVWRVLGLGFWFDLICSVVFFLSYKGLKKAQDPRWADLEYVVVNGSFVSDSPRVSISSLYTN